MLVDSLLWLPKRLLFKNVKKDLIIATASLYFSIDVFVVHVVTRERVTKKCTVCKLVIMLTSRNGHQQSSFFVAKLVARLIWKKQ